MDEEWKFHSLKDDKKNMSVKLFDEISKMIISGKLPSGYCFPNENEMCSSFGVGRSTLREAYAMLSLFGYIDRTKRGTYVNAFRDIISASPLSVTTQDASDRDYKEFRLLIEGATAKAAALRSTDREIQRLGEILAEYHPNATLDELVEADMNFHLYIAELSKNVLLCNTIIAVSSDWKRGVMNGFTKLQNNQPHLLEKVMKQHNAVYSAIRSHDGHKAEQLMVCHLDEVL